MKQAPEEMRSDSPPALPRKKILFVLKPHAFLCCE
jgi:hypothetical protein